MNSREKTARHSEKKAAPAATFDWSVSITRSAIDFMNAPSVSSGCNCDCSGYVKKDEQKAPSPEKR